MIGRWWSERDNWKGMLEHPAFFQLSTSNHKCYCNACASTVPRRMLDFPTIAYIYVHCLFPCHHSPHHHWTTNRLFVIWWWWLEGDDRWLDWKNEVLWCVHDDNFITFISQYHPYVQVAHSSSIEKWSLHAATLQFLRKKSWESVAEFLLETKDHQKWSKLRMVH
jgi:hypothetical protein